MEELYKLDLANSGLLEFTGAPVDPSSRPIELSSGWNWIGYLPSVPINIDAALATIGTDLDYIKSQGGYADYYAGFGWFGTLQTLAPFEGYMLDVAVDETLVYPSSGLARSQNYDNDINFIDFNYRDYEYNGSITSEINIADAVITESDLLNAYVDGECRGYVAPLLFPLTNKYIFPLMVYSNNNEENNMNFEYFNSSTNKYYTLDNSISFESDMIIGNGLTPFEFEGENNEIVSGLSVQSAYPNPFNPSTNIEYSISTSGNVKIAIYDVTGRQVDIIYNDYQSSGSHSIIWNAINSPSGIYYMQIQAQNDIHTQKVVLLK